jgi:hypothetical protein
MHIENGQSRKKQVTQDEEKENKKNNTIYVGHHFK